MEVKQISVFLENKPGMLRSMTQVLADHQIDIRALSLVETKDFGIARLIVDDVLDTMTVLKDEGFIGSLTPVVAAEIPDEPGALNKLLGIFARHEINLEYMYAFVGTKQGHAYMIFRVEDTKAASAALTEAGIKVVGQEELEEL